MEQQSLQHKYLHALALYLLRDRPSLIINNIIEIVIKMPTISGSHRSLASKKGSPIRSTLFQVPDMLDSARLVVYEQQ